MDLFSTAGDYAGTTATFSDSCFLIRHKDGDLLWDLGLNVELIKEGPVQSGITTLSLNKTRVQQLEEIDMVPKEGERPSKTIQYTSYDCSLEKKVCYKGKCVEDNEELRQSKEYKEEVEECKEIRKEMSFWQRINYWFKGIFS